MSRFARSSKNCDFSCVAKNRKSDDFSQFFVMLIITSPERVVHLTKFARIAKNRKSDDFFHFSRIHDHLK